MIGDQSVDLVFYMDSNALHYRRVQRAPGNVTLVDLDSLFRYAGDGYIRCVTSSFSRIEMINITKRAAYATQELSRGRTDVEQIVRELRDKMLILPAGLSCARASVDDWLAEEQATGRLRLRPMPNWDQVFGLAETLMAWTSLAGSGDCIQVAAAILVGATHFVTEDEHVRRCVAVELVAEGECRTQIRGELGGMTGTPEFSLKAVGVHEAAVEVEQYVALLRRTRTAGLGDGTQ